MPKVKPFKKMRNIKKLARTQKDSEHPGHALGEFLMIHSSSIEYLVDQLEGYLAAANKDHEEWKKAVEEAVKEERKREKQDSMAEDLYHKVLGDIEADGHFVPVEADDMLSDVCRLIAENQED